MQLNLDIEPQLRIETRFLNRSSHLKSKLDFDIKDKFSLIFLKRLLLKLDFDLYNMIKTEDGFAYTIFLLVSTVLQISAALFTLISEHSSPSGKRLPIKSVSPQNAMLFRNLIII